MLKFVYGSTLANGPKSWYLHLDTSYPKADCNIFATRYLMECITKLIERSAGHTEQPWFSWYTKPLTQLPDILKERAGWYMNKSGGMSPRLVEITKTTEIKYRIGEPVEWPEEEAVPKKMTKKEIISKARIIRWPQGKHFYAKLPDGTDVVWDDMQKWSTEQSARAAIKKFVRKYY